MEQVRQLLQRIILSTVVLLIAFFSFDGRNLAVAETCPHHNGNTPTRPFVPIDAWIVLGDGNQHWYAFRDEGDGAEIRIRMSTQPENRASLRVFTATQMMQWLRGEAVNAVGAGTPLPVLNNDLYWTGSFVQSGIYYVLIESNDRGDSSYMLSIRGADVSFPLVSFSQPLPPKVNVCSEDNELPVDPVITPLITPTATPIIIPTRPPVGTTEVTRSSPQMPLPPVGREVQITNSETHWYAFRDEGDDGIIEINADTTPDRCLTFEVWTSAELQRWQRNEPVRPVGQGTPNTLLQFDLFWTGSFVKSGIYYVVVERDPMASGTCTYRLRVTGEDVSLILPPRGE